MLRRARGKGWIAQRIALLPSRPAARIRGLANPGHRAHIASAATKALMSERCGRMVAGRRRATAKPRWGWGGAAPLTAAQLSLTDIELETLLPGRQNPIEQIALALCDLGGRDHRYLHQAEFGPPRAERMAALRLLLDQLNLLSSRLDVLPGHLRLWLSTQLVF